MPDEVDVRVRFTIIEDGVSFADALYYPLAEYPGISQATKNTAKTARHAAWKAAMAAARDAPQVPAEEQIAAVDVEVARLLGERAKLQEVIAARPRVR